MFDRDQRPETGDRRVRRLFGAGVAVMFLALTGLAAAHAAVVIPGIPKPGISVPDKYQLPRELTRHSSLREGVVAILNFALKFVGLIGVVIVIYAGFLYLTSGGSEDRGKQAKKAIGYMVIGIILILLSWVIVNTVLSIPLESGNTTGVSGGAGGIAYPKDPALPRLPSIAPEPDTPR